MRTSPLLLLEVASEWIPSNPSSPTSTGSFHISPSTPVLCHDSEGPYMFQIPEMQGDRKCFPRNTRRLRTASLSLATSERRIQRQLNALSVSVVAHSSFLLNQCAV